MNFSENDYSETKEMARLLKKIDTIDAKYVDATTDEMYQYQPFLLSILLGYQHDLKLTEVDEIMKIYFTIWEHFKARKNIQAKKITEEQFESFEKTHLHFFQYLEGSDARDKDFAITSDIENQPSKALLAAILLRFNTRPVLLSMDEYERGIIIIGLRSSVDCFEVMDDLKV